MDHVQRGKVNQLGTLCVSVPTGMQQSCMQEKVSCIEVQRLEEGVQEKTDFCIVCSEPGLTFPCNTHD